MNDSSVDKHSKANALLALGVTRESSAYATPSDEELASLLEAGLEADSIPGLDATRRAQVVDAIANDPATFNRWMSLVDAAQALELGGFAPTTQTAGSAKARTGWLKSFFTNPFKGLVTAGGGLVAASALMLMVTTTDDFQSQVDQLYGDYGSQWTSQPAKLSTTRSVSSTLKQSLSAEDSALYTGMNAGLKKMGDAFSLPNLVDKSVLSTQEVADSELAENLLMAGQIAALSHFKCTLGANPAYFTESMLLLEALQPVFAERNDETSLAIKKVLARRGDAETRVCRFSKLVISRVSF